MDSVALGSIFKVEVKGHKETIPAISEENQ